MKIQIANIEDRAHIKNKEMTLGELLEQKLARPGHQRKNSAWKRGEKQDLAKVALSGWGMPNIFVRVKETANNTRYTIEDGLQRTTALLSFIKGQLPLPANTIFTMPDGWTDPELPEMDEDMEIVGHDTVAGEYDGSGKTFDQLPEIIRDQFASMPVMVSYMHNFTDEQTRVYFKMLQQGTPLNVTEKRNATHRSLAGLLGGLTSANAESSRLFRLTGTQLTAKQVKNGKTDRMKDTEQALAIMTVINAEDNLGLSASAKAAIAEQGITRDSEVYKLTQTTLVKMADVLDSMSDPALVKATVIPPLARVLSERIAGKRPNNTKKIADALELFLTEVNATSESSVTPTVRDFRNASLQGAGNNAQMSRRVAILKDVMEMALG